MINGTHVWADGRPLQSEHAGRGIGRYVANHLSSLVRGAPGTLDAVVVDRSYPAPELPEPIDRQLLLPVRKEPPRPDAGAPAIFHVTSPFENIAWPWLWPRGFRSRDSGLVVTAYDLIPLIFADHYLAATSNRVPYEAHCAMIRAADAVLAISDNTASDVCRLLGVDERRVYVIGSGVSPEFEHRASGGLPRVRQAIPGIADEFVLYVGGVDFRKNLAGAVRGFARLPRAVRSRHQLVIACHMEDAAQRDLRALARELGIDDRLVLTGYVPDGVLADLYATCSVFMFPSLYEGFGLPVAEAQLQGAVVIVGNNSSLRELVKDERLTFNPWDPGSIAGVLERALTDKAVRAAAQEQARSASFTWADVATRTLPAYEAVARTLRRRRRFRRRAALVTPYPPDVSGIAEHSQDLAVALSADASVDVVVDREPGPGDVAPPGGRLVSIDGFPVTHDIRRYDRVIYAMGNSSFHSRSLDALRRTGGEVLLHDGWLKGLYAWRAQQGGEPFDHALRRMYGDRLPSELSSAGWISDEDALRLDIRMLGDVIEVADVIWVHSRVAADAVRRDAARAQVDCPDVRVLPFAFPPVREAHTKPQPPGDASPLIVSMGLVAPNKQPDVLMESVAELRNASLDAEIAFVGGLDDGYRHELEATADRLHIRRSVTFTGEVSDDEYRSWLDRADLAVQLRPASGGEASLTVAEAMASGVPCVASNTGWFADLPHDTLFRVDPGCSASGLARTIRGALVDLPRRERVIATAREHARRNGMAKVAPLLSPRAA